MLRSPSLLLCTCLLAASCRTEIPAPPELPPAPVSGVEAPSSLEGQLICIYCSEPRVRQRSVDSAHWGRWHSGWNISDEPVVFAFPDGNDNRDGHRPSDVIRIDYFSATYAAKRGKLQTYPKHPLSRTRPAPGKVKATVKMPEWSMAPAYNGRSYYPELHNTRKFREAVEADAEVREAELGLYRQGLDIGAKILETDRAYLLKGDTFVSYKAEGGNRAVLYFDCPTGDSRYLGWYELEFVTANAGIAVQYARCRNRAIQVQPMTFCLAPMNFTDKWLTFP